MSIDLQELDHWNAGTSSTIETLLCVGKTLHNVLFTDLFHLGYVKPPNFGKYLIMERNSYQ